MSFTPKVLIAMPQYGMVHPAAARALHVGATAGRGGYKIIEASASLLPHTFNCALASALNLRDQDDCTHLAMLHSDVEPGDNWLDALWFELTNQEADLVSVVIPIKEPQADPRTSTAIGSRRDPWQEPRALRMSDISALPETFGPSDVCRDQDDVFLVNTGCWLADLRKPWWDDFSFNITSRIIHEPGQIRDVQTRPEDWEMSRHLDSAGAIVRATRRVTVRHHGQSAWSNRPSAYTH